jgi:large subunit ribosomal protein L4e
MKATVFKLDGSQDGQVELPSAYFEAEYRPDLIRRAFHALLSGRFQPKGAFPLAGMQTTAEYYGRRHAWRQTINTGRSRVPREKISGGRSGRVLQVPSAVKGRRAHPPKPLKILLEKINLKEKNAALRSAIGATANKTIVANRGHAFEGSVPIVVDDAFQSLKRVKEAKKTLETLGVGKDLLRAKEGRKMRSGRARLRKGGYKTPTSVLIIVAKDDGIWKATRNLPGVDCVSVEKLDAELLAPGGDAGRLCVWTKSAVENLGKEGLYS